MNSHQNLLRVHFSETPNRIESGKKLNYTGIANVKFRFKRPIIHSAHAYVAVNLTAIAIHISNHQNMT